MARWELRGERVWQAVGYLTLASHLWSMEAELCRVCFSCAVVYAVASG
jgi:hypothetical protein